MDAVRPPPAYEDRGNGLSATLREKSDGADRLDGRLCSSDSGRLLRFQTAAGWATAGAYACHT